MAYIFVLLKRRLLYQTILLILLFVVVQTKAQVYVKAKSITTEDGLSDNRITCFYKDKKDFVWIGTKNGLNRYDGYRMQVFRPTAGNSISNEIINDIAEDSRGHIWVATMNGLNRYDPVTNQWQVFMPLTTANVSDKGIPSNLVWDIDIDDNDRIWIASDVRKFCYYDIAAKTFTYFDWPAFVKDNPHFSFGNYNSIKRFAWKNKNELWLASNKALVLLNLSTKTFTYVAGNYRSEVYDLRYDESSNKVYWTTEGGKLLSWDEASRQLSETKPEPEPYPSTRLRLPQGNEIWLASENGLVRIDAGKAFLSHHIPQLSGSLQPGHVSAVLQQEDGVRWVGTSNGISLYDVRGANSFFLPLTSASDKESLNGMGSVYYDKKREIYFVCATSLSAVFLVHKKTGLIEKQTADATGKSFFHCNTVKADNENNTWLLTDDNAYRYDDARKAFVRFPMPNNNEQVLFRDMVQDADGNYWFGSFHNGLYYYLTKEKRFVQLQAQWFDHISTVTALHSDALQKNVWIGTFSLGFYCYNLPTKKLTPYFETAQHPEFSALNLVQDIAQDGSGAIWAATQTGGLFRFTEAKNGAYNVQHYRMQTGLPDNSFLALSANNDSLLWAMSGKDISALSTNGQALSVLEGRPYFNFSSYLSDVRFPHKMFYNSQDNELLVGVGGGLLFHSMRPSAAIESVPLAITGVKINGVLLPPSEMRTAATHALSFQQNNLVFDLALLHYGDREDFK
ncbi:MAG TPA: two-component regulator propeller domain-containing protein, partial [Flavisolibacter sp.]|nr:two-component regulator propeller domain-containing protein [Flavisolibacter sp.]